MTTDEWARAMARKKRRAYMREYLAKWQAAHPGYAAAWMREHYVPAKDRQPGEPRYRGKRRQQQRPS